MYPYSDPEIVDEQNLFIYACVVRIEHWNIGSEIEARSCHVHQFLGDACPLHNPTNLSLLHYLYTVAAFTFGYIKLLLINNWIVTQFLIKNLVNFDYS